jgi:predicted PurR-regulated permease PerM
MPEGRAGDAAAATTPEAGGGAYPGADGPTAAPTARDVPVVTPVAAVTATPDAALADEELFAARDPRTLFLGGIFTMLVFYALYIGREILLPTFFALLLNWLLQPVVRFLSKLRVPRIVSALLLIIVLFAGLGGLGASLAGPAAGWFEKVPQSLPQVEEKLRVFRGLFEKIQQASKQVEQIASAPGPAEATPVTVKGPGLSDWLFSSTQALVAGLVTTLVLLFFLLIAGDLFLRRLVEILPNFRDKKRAVEISHEVERNISAYLLTITMMNALVGLATGVAMKVCGVPDPVLWGALAFLLNYIPVLGPVCGIVLFFLIGLLTFDSVWQAAVPAGIYFLIHLAEGEAITPMLLAKRFTLNPVLVIGSLIFWHWMWGVAGMLLAVPALAVFKIVCDRVRPLMALGHFLEG